jgi:hypothetical protein
VLPPRERVPDERERVPVPRPEALRGDLDAPVPLDALFAPDARLEPVLDDAAREDVDLRPVDFAAEPVGLARAEVEREPVGFARDVLDRVPDDRPPRPELLDDEPELVLASPSTDHLPDMTRCAASATASAMMDPSLVALDTTLLAAAVAVSAASRPASRILRRAAGLALIAAAAAASPAASISLLIAALARRSTVSLPEELEEPEEPEDVLFEDLAIASSPSIWRKRHLNAVTVP